MCVYSANVKRSNIHRFFLEGKSACINTIIIEDSRESYRRHLIYSVQMVYDLMIQAISVATVANKTTLRR